MKELYGDVIHDAASSKLEVSQDSIRDWRDWLEKNLSPQMIQEGALIKIPQKKDKIPKEALKEDQIKPKNYLSVYLKSKPVMKKLVLLVTC